MLSFLEKFFKPEYTHWPIINNTNNQAKQKTLPQPVEYSSNVHACLGTPNSSYKTNSGDNESTADIRN